MQTPNSKTVSLTKLKIEQGIPFPGIVYLMEFNIIPFEEMKKVEGSSVLFQTSEPEKKLPLIKKLLGKKNLEQSDFRFICAIEKKGIRIWCLTAEQYRLAPRRGKRRDGTSSNISKKAAKKK